MKLKVRKKEIIGDEASEEGRLEDIFGDVSNNDGSTNHLKLDHEVHENIEYILKREKILKEDHEIKSNLRNYPDGDGNYLAEFKIFKGDVEVYEGLAEGDISGGELMDIELQVKKQ